jgi:hypothetical protein
VSVFTEGLNSMRFQKTERRRRGGRSLVTPPVFFAGAAWKPFGTASVVVPSSLEKHALPDAFPTVKIRNRF